MSVVLVVSINMHASKRFVTAERACEIEGPFKRLQADGASSPRPLKTRHLHDYGGHSLLYARRFKRAFIGRPVSKDGRRVIPPRISPRTYRCRRNL